MIKNNLDAHAIINTLFDAFRGIQPLVTEHAGKTEHSLKADGTPQTDIDVKAEALIRNRLDITHPDLIHFGEESGYSEELPALCCLIDAVDGTKSYLQGVPAYTGMAVIIREDVAIASLVFDYSTKDVYVAFKGEGAYKNGHKLNLSVRSLPKQAFCRERLVTSMNELLKREGHELTCEAGPSGAGHGFALVADGKIAARFNFPHVPGRGYIHDYAPGALLVSEAGGAVISVEGDPEYTLATRSFVACHPELASFVSEHVSEIRKLELELNR